MQPHRCCHTLQGFEEAKVKDLSYEKLQQIVKGGLTALVYGGSALERIEYLMEVAKLALKEGSFALYFSIYEGSTFLIVDVASRKGLENLLDKIYVAILPLDVAKLGKVIEALRDLLNEEKLTLIVYDQVFTAIYYTSLGDPEVKSRLNTLLSMVKALSRKHGFCTLLLDRAKVDGSPQTPRFILRYVDESVSLRSVNV